MSNSVKVVVKLRRRSDKENSANLKEQWAILGNSLSSASKSFTFDYLFSSSSTNNDVFVGVIAPMVQSCKDGFNATIFTYGQKASGKTYTMMGTDEDPGIKILAIEHLFKSNQSASNRRQFIIRVGYVEIYNEMVYDLLNRRQRVNFSHNGGKLSNKEVIVRDQETVLKLLQKGNNAKTPTTGSNRSTSHTIFQIIIESQDEQSGQFHVSHLDFVDLDQSEGALVKDESGNSVDKSLTYFVQAISALGKGEQFRQFSKSKLTRILHTTLGGNANIAIICTINPVVENQTTCTLNFAEEAKKAKTSAECNKAITDDVLMKKVLAKSHRLSASPKFVVELAEMESIFLMEKYMRPKCHKRNSPKLTEVLKTRPFFVDLSGQDKKYQNGEMDGKRIDAQSRAQRKNMAFKWSDNYLERVGFELNINMRRYLKFGRNRVGRSDVDDDNDICIDSLLCSRKHCLITIADDESVSLTDLNSSNGTTINGIVNKGQTVTLREGDIISIVGNKSLPNLVGNFECTVYRICKLANERIQTYDLNDEVLEISDDDGDGTLYLPVKMELELPLPSIFVEVQTSTDESTVTETIKCHMEKYQSVTDNVEQNQSVAENLENNQLGTRNMANNQSVVEDVEQRQSNESVERYPFVTENVTQSQSVDNVATEVAATSDYFSNLSSDPKSDSGYEFDMSTYIFDASTSFEDLGEIIGPSIAEVETSNLGNLARELDIMSKVQENIKLIQQFDQLKSDYKNDKKLFAEEQETVQLKFIALAEENKILQDENSILTAETRNLKSKLMTLTREKSVLQGENSKMQAHFTRYSAEIELVLSNLTAFENNRNTLQDLNEQAAKLLQESAEVLNKKPKLN